MDLAPGSEPLPLDRDARWRLVEELAPRQQGALIMSSNLERRHFLDAVGYCTP